MSGTNGSGRLRVLYVSDVAWPRVNGVSTSIAVFRRELLALGHDVPLLAPRYGEGPTADDPSIVRLDGRRVPYDPEDRFVPARRFVSAAAALDFDLVHVQTPFAAHLAGRRIARQRLKIRVRLSPVGHAIGTEQPFNFLRIEPFGKEQWGRVRPVLDGRGWQRCGNGRPMFTSHRDGLYWRDSARTMNSPSKNRKTFTEA